MKKYLMTGVAALAFAATFTSCSKTDLYDENKVNEEKEATVNEKYAAAFEKAFGKVGANVDWGFSSQAKTRATVNVNGNMWDGWPEVTAAEAQAVYDYVNKVKTQIEHYSETAPTNLTNYYVTQVRGGKEDDPNCNYGSYDNPNNKTVFGPSKMNNLHIAQTTEQGAISIDDNGHLQGYWEHINNFNAASNANYGGNTLIEGGGTLDFAYESSEDSKYHNKWIIIDGQYITDSEGVTHTGKYYVCFDFISWKSDCKTNFRNGGLIQVPGCWHNGAEAIAAGITKGKDENGTMVDIDPNWQSEQVVSGNMCVPANDIYTDWIIRLVNADEVTPPETHLYRVIAEDLSAGEAGDFDFNDVVFDVIGYDQSTDKTTLRLQACGGTLPLKIGSTNGVGGEEVHALYGDNAPDATTGKYKMWNTGLNSHAAVDFTVDGEYTTPEQLLGLRIEVQKGEQWMLLTAEKGKAACKVLVDDRFDPIVPERHSIVDQYLNFTTYVQGNWKTADEKFWWVQE